MEQKRELCLGLVFCLVFFGILFVLFATIGEEGVGLVIIACVVIYGIFILFLIRDPKPKKIRQLRKGRCPSCGKAFTIETRRTPSASSLPKTVEVRCNACGWEYSSPKLCPQCHFYGVKVVCFSTPEYSYEPYAYKCKKCGWKDAEDSDYTF